MSNDAKAGSPLTFKAGGSGRRPSGKAKEATKKNSGDDHVEPPRLQPSRSPPSGTRRSSNALTIARTGLSHKRSPLELKSWIACVLTLDGRDKFTKVLQYSSRLLCWYFAGLAGAGAVPPGTGSLSVAASSPAAPGVLAAVITDIHLRRKLYSALSARFEALYKSLVTSRKAFRLGRSVIELDKLKSMGWGEYLGYMLTHPLAGGAAGGAEEDVEAEGSMQKRGGVGSVATHTLERYDTHPIPEEEESHDEDDDDDYSSDESSWNEDSADDDDDGCLAAEEKKSDHVSPKKVKVVTRPGRPRLPTRISSNIGWGPSTTSSTPASVADNSSSNQISSKRSAGNPPPARTVSEMGRNMYQPFPSRSSSMGSYKQVKEPPSSVEKKLIQSPPPAVTPSWKLIGGTVKLLGLMGFWAFDNLSFLTGAGFLDPICLQPSSPNAVEANDPSALRLKRKKRASILAARCYFFGVVGGLYVNARALWGHRNGSLRDARTRLDKALRSSGNSPAENRDDGDVVGKAKNHLELTERKHFELSLALLKSCCDFMVFSNNPGIDLHLKLRGRKNHEGLHCLGGLVSASTVLYNNFPNADR